MLMLRAAGFLALLALASATTITSITGNQCFPVQVLSPGSLCPNFTISTCSNSQADAQFNAYYDSFTYSYTSTASMATGQTFCSNFAGATPNNAYWNSSQVCENVYVCNSPGGTNCATGGALPAVCCSYIRKRFANACSGVSGINSLVSATSTNPLTTTIVQQFTNNAGVTCQDNDCFNPETQSVEMTYGTGQGPEISPASGSYGNVVFVRAKGHHDFDQVYYTTDGSTPSTSSNVFNGEVMITSSAVFKAFSVGMNGNVSSIVSQSYTIVPTSTISISFSQPSGTTFESYGSVIVSTEGASSLTVNVVSVSGTTSYTANRAFRVFMGTLGTTQVSATATFTTATGNTLTQQSTATYTIVAATQFNQAVQAPEMCFANGECLDLYGYLYDKPLSEAEFNNLCGENPSQGGGCISAWQQVATQHPYDVNTMNRYHGLIAYLGMYVWGVFMGNQNEALRTANGYNTPASLLAVSALTASGIHVMNLNATTQAYIRPDFFIYRGEPNFAGAPCPPVSPYQPGIQLTGTTREIWGFDSWSRSFEMSRSWFGANRVMMMYKRNQDKRGGAFIYPFDLLGQYEVTYPPGTRVKSLACEQMSFSEVGDSGNIAVEYIYDVTDESEMSPADEVALLQTMRQELINANNSCWTASCTCSGVSPAAQSLMDPNTPIPNSVCLTMMNEFLAEGADGARGEMEMDAVCASSGASAGIAVAAIAVVVILVAAVYRMRSGRRAYLTLGEGNAVEML